MYEIVEGFINIIPCAKLKMKNRNRIIIVIAIIISASIHLYVGSAYAQPETKPTDFRNAAEKLNTPVIIIIESIGAVLIVGFVIFYVIKKRTKQNLEERK